MKALIADDDVTTRRMLRVVLLRWGYEVVEAADGTEAWEHFMGPSPAALAILDWTMPGVSGPDLCRRLRSRGQVAGPYVILLTARSHWKDVVLGLEAGADDFVAKPYQVEELRARVAVGRRIVDLQQELLNVNGALESRVRERTERIHKLLEQSQELVGQLGHDLRTPLTPLMALLPILLGDERDPERREWLGLCLDQVRYLKRLASRVSDLGRLESPQTPLSLLPIQILPVVQAATEFVGIENSAGLAERRAMIDLPPTLEVYGDVVWLERVFVDLLDNAFRFSPTGTPVTVKAESGEQEVVVEVADQGQGLAPEQLSRLFDPFYMGDSARTDRNTNGLGLAICRRIVERHGGRIWAESAGPGLGTRVRFTLYRAGQSLPVHLERA
jgi:signal transduction histidine kinase